MPGPPETRAPQLHNGPPAGEAAATLGQQPGSPEQVQAFAACCAVTELRRLCADLDTAAHHYREQLQIQEQKLREWSADELQIQRELYLHRQALQRRLEQDIAEADAATAAAARQQARLRQLQAPYSKCTRLR